MAGLGWDGVFNGRFNHPQKPSLSNRDAYRCDKRFGIEFFLWYFFIPFLEE